MRRAWVAAAILAAALRPSASQTTEDVEAQIRRLADQVGDIAGKQRGILDQVDLLKRRIRLNEAVLRRLAEERRRTSSELESARETLVQTAGRQARAEEYLRARIRQQYALGLLQEYRLYFTVNSTQDLRAAGLYLQALTTRDAARLRELQLVRRQQEEARSSLQALTARQEEQAEETAREQGLLQEQQVRLSALVSRLDRERKTAEQALDESLRAARGMDRYMEDLAFRKRVEIFTKNMADVKGRLPFPCEGRAGRGFGDYVHPRFRTRVPHPGLDIAAPLGTPVRAVFDGVVEYAGWLSGYGYTVILRHPGGYFTVYAHMDQIAVSTGQSVFGKEGLGSVGEIPSLGRTALYFELREGGRAVDPRPWLEGGSDDD
jgi:septal ring factor EnvC (AmiA/AmiB activator)